MNVNPGGKHPVMQDTTWNGMVLPDGCPKGMKMVQQERGIDTKGMNAERLRATLESHPDFRNPETLIEERVEARGHLCIFPSQSITVN